MEQSHRLELAPDEAGAVKSAWAHTAASPNPVAFLITVTASSASALAVALRTRLDHRDFPSGSAADVRARRARASVRGRRDVSARRNQLRRDGPDRTRIRGRAGCGDGCGRPCRGDPADRQPREAVPRRLRRLAARPGGGALDAALQSRAGDRNDSAPRRQRPGGDRLPFAQHRAADDGNEPRGAHPDEDGVEGALQVDDAVRDRRRAARLRVARRLRAIRPVCRHRLLTAAGLDDALDPAVRRPDARGRDRVAREERRARQARRPGPQNPPRLDRGPPSRWRQRTSTRAGTSSGSPRSRSRSAGGSAIGATTSTRSRSEHCSHDIGKIGVPERILHKPGPLDDSEWETMRRHPDRLTSSSSPASTSHRVRNQIARSGHERFDGKGYPEGLAGEDIPLPARIVLVADTFDALTSDRPYRDKRPPAPGPRRDSRQRRRAVLSPRGRSARQAGPRRAPDPRLDPGLGRQRRLNIPGGETSQRRFCVCRKTTPEGGDCVEHSLDHFDHRPRARAARLLLARPLVGPNSVNRLGRRPLPGGLQHGKLL